MIQIAAGLAQCKRCSSILQGKDMEWVAESSRLSPRMEKRLALSPRWVCLWPGCFWASAGDDN